VGSGNLHNKNCRRRCGTGTEAFHRPCGQVSPRFRGQGLDVRVARVSPALVAGRAASLLARAVAARPSTTGL
jgi:hypothetical protein